jgi:putrescine transport system ATP-binding protein
LFLEVEHVDKAYGPAAVLRRVSLAAPERSTTAILGRSGSGKTTLLKIVAGLEGYDGGQVRLAGRLLDGVPPERRGTVYLYQEPLLFPHLNVFDNVAFGLQVQRLPRDEITERVEQTITSLGLKGHEAKHPDQLSGGQRQRVSFGRALIIRPRLLLLDEPFGNLDPETRRTMQELFKRVAAEYRITSLFVTHDLKEALLVGDRFGFIDRGALTAYGSKQEFVADPRIGASEEIRFWNAVANGREEAP